MTNIRDAVTLLRLTPPRVFSLSYVSKCREGNTARLAARNNGLPSCSCTTKPAMGHSLLTQVSNLSLSLLLLSRPVHPLPAPPPAHCAGHYDCTATENSLFAHFARLPDISACQARCQEDARCKHFTFNYKQHSLYPGGCFLLRSCSSRRPGASQWV